MKKLIAALLVSSSMLAGCPDKKGKSGDIYQMDGDWVIAGTYTYSDAEGDQTGSINGALVVVDQVGDHAATLGYIGLPDAEKVSLTGDMDQFYFGPYIKAEVKVSGWLNEEAAGNLDYEVELFFLEEDLTYSSVGSYTIKYEFTEVKKFDVTEYFTTFGSQEFTSSGEVTSLIDMDYLGDGAIVVRNPVTKEAIRAIPVVR